MFIFIYLDNTITDPGGWWLQVYWKANVIWQPWIIHQKKMTVTCRFTTLQLIIGTEQINNKCLENKLDISKLCQSQFTSSSDLISLTRISRQEADISQPASFPYSFAELLIAIYIRQTGSLWAVYLCGRYIRNGAHDIFEMVHMRNQYTKEAELFWSMRTVLESSHTRLYCSVR